MKQLHYYIQIRLAKKEFFFGPGVLSLLRLVQKYKSLSIASKKMNLSYSKAYKMVKGSEEALGFKLLNRKIGGLGGGGSTLTPECVKFIDKYSDFSKEIDEKAFEIFKKYFDEYI